MTQKRWKKALFALGVLVALVLGLEVACRLVFPPPPVAEPLPAKAPGTFRVIAVGGSTVRGLHVPEMGFVAQLEELLRTLRPDAPVEVWNFGKGARASTLVRRVVEETLDDEPDLYVVLTGHNEFLFRTGKGGAAEAIRAGLRRSALFRTATKALDKLSGPPVKRDSEYVLPKKLVPYDRESEWFAGRRSAFLENLAAIAEETRAVGVPLVLCTAPANLYDWPPVHEAVAWAKPNPDYDADVARIEGLLAGGDAAGALADAERVLADHGDDAMVHWLAGQALAALGEHERARDALLRASDLDPYPWRVLSEFNAAVRSTAERPGVALADVVRAFEEDSAGGLVGFELVSDNCHPTPLGNAVAALVIARAMADRGWFLEPGAELPEADPWLGTFLAEVGADGRMQALRVRYLLDNGVYCMKTPFRNWEAADTYFSAGTELAPDNWIVWANHGTLALLAGDVELGRERLARAAALKGSALDADDPGDSRAVPYLKEATIRAGVDLARLPAFEDDGATEE